MDALSGTNQPRSRGRHAIRYALVPGGYVVGSLLATYLFYFVFKGPVPVVIMPPLGMAVTLLILNRVSSGQSRKRLRYAAIIPAVALIAVVFASAICQDVGWRAYKKAGGIYGACWDPKEMTKASRYLGLAWRTFPLNRDALYYKGDALLRLGRYDEALNAFEWTARLYPRYFSAHYGKAICYKQLGDFEGMLSSLRKARAISWSFSARARFAQDFAEFKNDPRFAEFKDQF